MKGASFIRLSGLQEFAHLLGQATLAASVIVNKLYKESVLNGIDQMCLLWSQPRAAVSPLTGNRICKCTLRILRWTIAKFRDYCEVPILVRLLSKLKTTLTQSGKCFIKNMFNIYLSTAQKCKYSLIPVYNFINDAQYFRQLTSRMSYECTLNEYEDSYSFQKNPLISIIIIYF